MEAGVSFVFSDAVDGRWLDTEAMGRPYDRDLNGTHFKRPLSSGEIGCYLSHQALWKTVAEGERPAALILEDDCVVAPGLAPFLAAIERYNLTDLVLKLDGSRRRRRRTRRVLAEDVGGVQVIELEVVAPHTTGYIIGRRAAAAMLAVRQRFFRPVDTDMKFVWEHGVPILATDPILVRSADADSMICAGREALKPRSPLVRLVRNLRYQSDFFLRRHEAHTVTDAFQLTEADHD
jgi:glycosyl transferase family 25